MRTLLIVYHSRTGGTRQMAEAAAAGATTETGVRTRLLTAANAHCPVRGGRRHARRRARGQRILMIRLESKA